MAPPPLFPSRPALNNPSSSPRALDPSPSLRPKPSNTADLLNQLNHQLPSTLPFSISPSKSDQLSLIRSKRSNLPYSPDHAFPSLQSTPSHPFSISNASPTTPSLSSPGLKLDMMAKLLCSQALVESSSFQALSYDRVERLKKRIVKLEHQLDSLNSHISLELKIREATSIMLATASDPPDEPPDRGLLAANAALDKLRADKDALQDQLHGARTRLLQHLAAVLGLGLKKLEHQIHPAPAHSPLDPSPRFPVRSPRSASPAPTNRSSRSTALTLDRFDGPHLFANNHQLGTPPRPSLLDTGQADALSKELKSLKSLLVTKEATIAEQASDLSLLELELDTLKHSRAKASTAQADAMQTRNDALSDEVARLRVQAGVSERWRAEADALRAELARERASATGEQQTVVARAREAEDRAREAERVRAELAATGVQLEAQCAAAEADAARTRAEIAELSARAQTRESELDEQLAQLRAEAAEQAAQGARQSADSREWDEMVDRLSALGPSEASRLGRLVGRFAGPAVMRPARKVVVEELVEGVKEHLVQVEELKVVRAEVEEAQRVHEEERGRLEARIGELEQQLGELESGRRELVERMAETGQMEALQAELAQAQKRLEDAEAHMGTDKVLRELYKTLPSNLDARAGVGQEGELASFRSAYEQPQKAAAGLGGLGGLFGLGKRAATPTPAEESNNEYSVETLVEKIKIVVESDKKLVERLAKYEAEKVQHKSNALKDQKLITEAQEALRTHQQQVRELEERLEYADTQSAAMLEKVNDLMESEEKANMTARRCESQTSALQSQLNSLQSELSSLRETHSKTLASTATTAELRQELKSAREQVEDLVAEIEEVKGRERKERERFLELVREAQDEAGVLRSKVRVLERAQKA